MNKSVIVYGPPGCGKSRWAKRIADHFGMLGYHDDWDKSKVFTKFRNLYLTSDKEGAELFGRLWSVRVMSFAEVAQQINDAIPLTDWQSGSPPAVGEWQTRFSPTSTEAYKRWWNGEVWSCVYFEGDSQETKNDCAGTDSIYEDIRLIQWRGLAEEPIVVTA